MAAAVECINVKDVIGTAHVTCAVCFAREACVAAKASTIADFLCLNLFHDYVIALTQACCQPVLQSITEQWGLHFAQTSAAMHFCWPTAHLYNEQISTDVNALTQACCELVLQRSTEQWGIHCALTTAVVHEVGSLHSRSNSRFVQV